MLRDSIDLILCKMTILSHPSTATRAKRMTTIVRKANLDRKQYGEFMLLFEKTLLAWHTVNEGKHVRNFINYDFVAHKLLSLMSITSDNIQEPEVSSKIAKLWLKICQIDTDLKAHNKKVTPAQAALLIQQACRPWLDSFITKDQQLGIRARISLKELLLHLEK